MHLTWEERRQAVLDVAETVSKWGFARLFAECVDKSHFNPMRSRRSVGEQAFEQVVSRFERFLQNVGGPGAQRSHGLLVHDNNETVARRHTDMMRSFHATGTLWASVDCIIETPMFVDSKLTRMVQIADLCAYALRRYLENDEIGLFRPIFERADRIGDVSVGVRHFSRPACDCPSVSRTKLEPGTSLGEKLTYIVNQWDELLVFLHNGRVEVDSNFVENQIRAVKLTAKPVETCKMMNGVEPNAWLESTLEKVASGHPQSRIRKLLRFKRKSR